MCASPLRAYLVSGIESGEGGIRTRDGACTPYSLSRRVPSATRPPLRIADRGRPAQCTPAWRPTLCGGGVAERSNAPVLKTGRGHPGPSGVRIPPPPLSAWTSVRSHCPADGRILANVRHGWRARGRLFASGLREARGGGGSPARRRPYARIRLLQAGDARLGATGRLDGHRATALPVEADALAVPGPSPV